jgi:chymotrypsin
MLGNIWKITFLLCCLKKATTSATTNLDSRIVGGQPSPGVYFYQLSLQNSNHQHFCGAVIISTNFFVTAAHCVFGQTVNQLSVLAGVTNNQDDNGGSRRPVEKCKIHENYVELVTSDIAICKLTEPLVFGPKIWSVLLDNNYVGGGVQTILTGWGSISMVRDLPVPLYSTIAYPTQLQRAILPTITDEECKKTHDIDNTQICTFSRVKKGACAG